MRRGEQPLRDLRQPSIGEHGQPQRPDCHEAWKFGSIGSRATQRLVRLIALCRDCHRVQHSGRARVVGEEHLVTTQMMKLNGWTEQQAVADLRRSSDRCQRLTRYEWDLDLTLLQGRFTVAGHPSLLFPATARAALGSSYRAQ